ncbi:hypothetical protein GE21DRAFT_4709 [Neurospora crassa]|uniref:Uncharacterized protein n=1 Tax=Neurospora crassa (strain ATCC 24698 / 74-OR23-1A / CBS 708.71 / DSM 1257 / FGSC 987) TaxID=367110 RepID=Q7RYS2_NEUCR|nr:hypothetical protein NCU00388 [Neurospora crassa OR74A]EAA28038.3 hypothetical protein NCU00388 [Neurospora crassa OR74A]KHE87863.1 hypothetical protein GE21DRAFT_4709 [Neurospora crassa]|eukprot:XP_957274.3 hypothetical protein NCU00388 [Neurospora crassa OR74A]
MDAQNAVEPASTKPAIRAASPKRQGSDSDQPRSSTVIRTSSTSTVQSTTARFDPIFRNDKNDRDNKHRINNNASKAASNIEDHDDSLTAEGNSDAETIVLPGKDGHHSPVKVRKPIIKQNDNRSDDDDVVSSHRKHANHNSSRQQQQQQQQQQDRESDRGDRSEKPDRSVAVAGNGPNGSNEGSVGSSSLGALGAKKRKLPDKAKAKDGSSGLSSAPESPPQRRRRSSNGHSKSDSEPAPVDSLSKLPAQSTQQDKPVPPKSLDNNKVVPNKRKHPKAESDDEAEPPKVRRQRTSGSGLDASRRPHPPPPNKSSSHHEPHASTRTRSVSPHARAHRRSISTQLPGHTAHGLSLKKRRVPVPLHSADYFSDESSERGSPHPRSSKLRSLATPAAAEFTHSPAGRMAPHKKHLDAHGQTFLARACAKGEYNVAKQRLQERPEDIDVADYAGNTPLQIAAINGFDDIVKLLVEAGCNLDCLNNEKDTPLIDAVENGHYEVVKILLDAGVNPRKANAYGEEPIDRVNEDHDNADDIKRAINEAKQRMGERRPTSEDHHLDHATDTRSSHGPDSPRQSPASASINPSSGRRAGTVRATKTSNHLLYMPMDDKTLRAAAAKGDEETVLRILQVRDQFDDPESMVAAARGGHDLVMQLLLAIGGANPDPQPISTNEYSTPILAAIGQENIKVIRLLLDQANFDPTKKYKGETYYEIARKRRGPNWMQEEHMLKEAFDEYKKKPSSNAKSQRLSNSRETDREPRRTRTEIKEDASKSHRRKASSPAKEAKKTGPSKVPASPREKRRSDSVATHQEDQTSPKRGPGRPKKDDKIPTIAISDREASPAGRVTTKAKRADHDVAAASSEGETPKPRRKLISGRELKGEREKQRRASVTSNGSSFRDQPSSPRDECEKPQMMEKYHDRTKAIRRDESRDRSSVSGESSGKRHRASATPPHPGSTEKDPSEIPSKKRRLDVEGKDRRLKPNSAEDRHLKPSVSRESSLAAPPDGRVRSRSRDDEDRRSTSKPRKSESTSEHVRFDSGKPTIPEPSIHVKSEDGEVEMGDADHAAQEESTRQMLEKRKLQEIRKKQAEMESEARELKRKEEERKRKDEERERKRFEDESRRAAQEERQRLEELRKQRQAEEDRKRREEEEERKQREEEEAREREREREKERERKRREEEEEQKKKEAAERKRREQEEEERKRLEHEEKVRRERLEREAADEARRKREEERRKREEEERQEKERREKAMREEAERKRVAAQEAEERRIRHEQEVIRIANLPPALRWLEGAANPRIPQIAEKFSIMQGVRYDCIDPEATGTPEGREQWLLNTQIALLLGEKDLRLSKYNSWTRIPASKIAKRVLWQLESDRYALTSPNLYDLGKELPGYYGTDDTDSIVYRVTQKLRSAAWEKFAALEMFFVKASDFLRIIPTMPHLRDIRLVMAYRELPENETYFRDFRPLEKWKKDPDAGRNHGFAPGSKYFVNGQFIWEERPKVGMVSKMPFEEERVPRRGLAPVRPDDPEYAELCRKQGLGHLLGEAQGSHVLPNGHRSASPISTTSSSNRVNGITSPRARTVNGHAHGHHPISPSSETGPAQARPLLNGHHEMLSGDEED